MSVIVSQMLRFSSSIFAAMIRISKLDLRCFLEDLKVPVLSLEPCLGARGGVRCVGCRHIRLKNVNWPNL